MIHFVFFIRQVNPSDCVEEPSGISNSSTCTIDNWIIINLIGYRKIYTTWVFFGIQSLIHEEYVIDNENF